jgi:hypothetical protein
MKKIKKREALVWYDKKGVKHTQFQKDENGNYPLWDDVKHNFRGVKK